MKTNRKNQLQREKMISSGLRKFLIPPEMIILQELRRIELMQRPLPVTIKTT